MHRNNVLLFIILFFGVMFTDCYAGEPSSADIQKAVKKSNALSMGISGKVNKIGCVKAVNRLGFFCDVIVPNKMLGGNMVLGFRLVKSGSDWLIIENSQ